MVVDKSKEALWRAMQQHNSLGRFGDGGSGGGDGGSSTHLSVKDYVDAKNEAMEERLLARLEQLATKSTIWGAVATGTAIILAVLAFAGDRFDAGLANSDKRLEQLRKDERQDANVVNLNAKLDRLIAAIPESSPSSGDSPTDKPVSAP